MFKKTALFSRDGFPNSGVDDYFDNDDVDDGPLLVCRKHRVIVNGYV